MPRRGGAVAIKVADATSEADVAALFDEADRDGDLALVAYNVGNNIAASAQDTTPELFERLWRQNALGGFVVGREAARRFSQRGQGTILFTGATASLRARPPFLAFAAAKAALRAVAQGLAREFGSTGVHVAHIVIDGVIAGEYAATNFADYVRSKGADGVLAVDDIADAYWALHCQKRSAWTSRNGPSALQGAFLGPHITAAEKTENGDANKVALCRRLSRELQLRHRLSLPGLDQGHDGERRRRGAATTFWRSTSTKAIMATWRWMG